MNERIAAALLTCPKVCELTLVSTPEYCTVFSALLAVMRASKLRVPPKLTVRESEPLSETVPGNWMELRDELP